MNWFKLINSRPFESCRSFESEMDQRQRECTGNKLRLKMRVFLAVQMYTESRKVMSGELSLVSVALVQWKCYCSTALL